MTEPEEDREAVERRTLSIWKEDGHVRRLSDIRNEIIEIAISRYDGSVGEVSRRLRVSRSMLHRKMRGES